MIYLPERKLRCESRGGKAATLACGILVASLPAFAQADEERAPEAATEANPIAIGTDLYPDVSRQTDQPRFDGSSNLLVNTIGARTGLFGAASREGETWANRYVPGTDLSGIVQLYSLSTSGNYGAFFGTRSSDNHSGRAQNIIGSINLVVADSDQPHLHWAQYSEGYVPHGQTAFRLLINDENSIQNESNPAPLADPYNYNPQQLLNNLRVDCGIGMRESQSCTNPISILNNGANYRVGILFGDKSIEVIDGAADAVALPAEYALSWYGTSGRPAWRIYSNARRAGSGKLVMSDDAMSIEVGSGGKTPALRVGSDAIAAPAMIASGEPPSISGSCGARERRGGQTAGSFAMARDCPAGKITIGFSTESPNGWACFASSLTQSEGSLRQTAFDRKSATLAVSNMRQSDPVVFSCTGF